MPRPKSAPISEAVYPSFALLKAAGVYALATLLLAYPALGGGFLVNPSSDQYIAGYAFRHFGAEALKSGGFAQWNPYLFGGMPYIAAMHGDIFYPSFLLRMIMPTDAAMTWSFIAHAFLAGVFAFCFFRAMRVGFSGSLVGGLAYMMSGNIAGLVSPGHDGKLYVSALLPLTLFLLVRGIRDGRLWSWGVLAFTIGLAALSPHPQLFQYLLLVAGAFALYLALADQGAGKLDRRIATRRLCLALGAVALGGMIAAVQYLPLREYTPFSPRAEGKGWEHAVSYSLPPEEVVNGYLPEFTGMLTNYWGRNGIHLHSDYLGAAVLVLAGLAFGAYTTRQRQTFTRFWLGVFIISLLWALGGNTPFYYLVYTLVPGTKFFRAPSTMLYVVSFALSVLAALGVERVISGDSARKRYLITWLSVAGGIALLATAGVMTGIATAIAGTERYEYVMANAGNVIVGAWRSFVFVALTVGVVFALRRGAITHRVAAWALAAIVCLDLWSIERRYWMFSPPANEIFASDPAIEYMKKQSQPGRVVALATANPEGTRDPYYYGSGFMAHGVRDVKGYHGNELQRYDELALTMPGGDFLRRIADPKFRRLANVRYIYTNSAQPLMPGSQLLVGPAKNSAGSTIYLYSVPEDNSYAWMAPLIVKATDAITLNTILSPNFDARQAAIFDTSASVTAKTGVRSAPAPLETPVTVTSYAPGHVALSLGTAAPAGSAVVVSENWYPGWQATVDGKPAVAARADYSLIGVELPAGARSVELHFDNSTYARGKAVTLFALALSALLIAAGLVLDRRRRG